MNTTCPECGSAETGPSFTFDWEKDGDDRVIARDPFFACAECDNTWQVETTMLVAKPVDPDDDEAVNALFEAINEAVVNDG